MSKSAYKWIKILNDELEGFRKEAVTTYFKEDILGYFPEFYARVQNTKKHLSEQWASRSKIELTTSHIHARSMFLFFSQLREEHTVHWGRLRTGCGG
jgi:hypothetical protein